MNVLTAANLNCIPGIAHGFFTREGGVSTGIYASLNCAPGSNDRRDAVMENRHIALSGLCKNGGGQLVTLHQIHSADAVCVESPWTVDNPPKADAMATCVPGIALGILTADCAPVLLADEQARVIGAAHAGWRGALSGVIDSVVAAMERLGANRARIAAAIGPCISQRNYEVAEDFRAQVLGAEADSERLFAVAERAHHWRFDLESYVSDRLGRAAVGNIVKLSACTYARDSEFFSYRRTTHLEEPDYGRQISVILLRI
jgi:YfiH family protein